MADIIFPILIVFVLTYSIIKKNDAYKSFQNGTVGAIDLIKTLLPTIVAMFIAIELFKVSGLSQILANILSPMFNLIGIPKELTELIIIRPFSSNAGYVVLQDIFKNYGVDSYVGRCASVLMGSSDTIFYVASIYFSATKVKKTMLTIPIAVLCNIFCAILSCLLCRFM